MQLLAAALAGPAAGRGAAVRRLSCKAEEIHTTLRKHLAKEEEQLFPLLLAHFSAAEQAELVAQFLCCIPLAAVQPVLAWLQPAVPVAEQEALLAQARARPCPSVPSLCSARAGAALLGPQEGPAAARRVGWGLPLARTSWAPPQAGRMRRRARRGRPGAEPVPRARAPRCAWSSRTACCWSCW